MKSYKIYYWFYYFVQSFPRILHGKNLDNLKITEKSFFNVTRKNSTMKNTKNFYYSFSMMILWILVNFLRINPWINLARKELMIIEVISFWNFPTVINNEGRLLTLKEGEGWCRTMLNGEGRCGHDDGWSVTFSHDYLEMVTGQNHNFYSMDLLF